MTDFLMPSLGADMDRAVIVEWLVKPGDHVVRGEPIILVETAKGIIEVEVWHDATIESIVVEAGEEAEVGAVLATLLEDEESRSRVKASPRARALADELGVDIAGLDVSGPVSERDVRAAAGATVTEPSLTMRRAIGRAMARSKREIPHYYLGTTIDLETALQWLEARNAERSVTERLLPAALLLKATALAATKVAGFNGHFDGDRFIPATAVHLGVAISLRGGGLIAPAIIDCHTKTIDEVMSDLSDLVSRARSGALRESEVSTPTLTVTNLGDRGVEEGYGIINPPQVAIVCVGSIARRPVVVGEEILARRVSRVTLSADHRVSDGHEGGLFLEAIDRVLQHPEDL